jgi:hypothetical protein
MHDIGIENTKHEERRGKENKIEMSSLNESYTDLLNINVKNNLEVNTSPNLQNRVVNFAEGGV